MRLSDILQVSCIKVPLAATTKQEAIFELADLLCEQTGIRSPQEFKDTIWKRELTRTTGIGYGVAIPHGKYSGCPSLAAAIGKPARPIEFGSVDDRPVDLIILLASPLDKTGPHIEALAAISKMLNDRAFHAAIRKAATPQEIYDLITQHEAQLAQ